MSIYKSQLQKKNSPTKIWQISIVFLTPLIAHAESATATDAGQAALGKLVSGLFAVLVIIYACAWLMKRLKLPNAFAGGPLKVESAISVGTKEKILLLNVGGQKLIVGVTAASIQTLYVVPAEERISSGENFAQQFNLAKKNSEINHLRTAFNKTMVEASL